MAPTIAVRTAPATPPPATWPMMLPISGVEALLASSGNQHPEELSSGTAADRPREWYFPSVPRSIFLVAPATTFPPTAH